MLWIAARDRRTPVVARLLIAIALAYALSPIDLIPDFIPVLGMLDDLILMPLALSLAIRLIPDNVIADIRLRMVAQGHQRPPRSRAGAIMIFIIWIGAAWILGTWAYDLLR